MSENYFDNQPKEQKKGVSVIAAFTSKGEIRTIYLRAVENEEEYPIKVIVVVEEYIEENIYDGHAIFECEYLHNNRAKRMTLRYDYIHHIWEIVKSKKN